MYERFVLCLSVTGSCAVFVPGLGTARLAWATIAARDCVRVIELTEQVIAAMLIAVRQGVALRRGVSTLHLADEQHVVPRIDPRYGSALEMGKRVIQQDDAVLATRVAQALEAVRRLHGCEPS